MEESNRTAEKYCEYWRKVRIYAFRSVRSSPRTSGTLKNIETEPILAKKLVSETARGVLCFMSRSGITGYAAIFVSMITKANPQTELTDTRPHTSGCDQGSSSVDFRDRPSKKHPTVNTSVNDPKKSIRFNFVRRGRDRISSGSGILTFVETSTTDRAKMGACSRF